MGWRMRKSIKLGKNTRLNLNKKGFSVSTGAKGARVTVNNKGKVTRTVGIPGTGIYNTKQFDLNKKENKKQPKHMQNNRQLVKSNPYVHIYLIAPSLIETISHGFKASTMVKNAIIAFKVGDTDKCFKLSEEVLKIWPDCNNAKAFMAIKFYRVKQYETAISIVESLPKKYREDPAMKEVLEKSRFFMEHSNWI